jgi:hypothetical protein
MHLNTVGKGRNLLRIILPKTVADNKKACENTGLDNFELKNQQ